MLLKASSDLDVGVDVGAFQVDLSPDDAHDLLAYLNAARELRGQHVSFAYVEFWDYRGAYLRGDLLDDGTFEAAEPDEEGSVEVRTEGDRVVVTEEDFYWTAYLKNSGIRLATDQVTRKELEVIRDGKEAA